MYMCVYVCTHIHICACVFACEYMNGWHKSCPRGDDNRQRVSSCLAKICTMCNVCIYICIYMYMYIYVYVYVYIYIRIFI